MKSTRIALSLTAAALLAALPALAQDAPSGPGADDGPAAKAPAKDAVHEHWDAMEAAKAAMRDAGMAKDKAAMDAARKDYTAASERFVEVLGSGAWEKIDAAAEKDLLATGLQLLINDALTKKEDGRLAVKYCEALLAKFPDLPSAKSIAGSTLATAWLKAGDVAKATSVWEKAAASDDVNVKCSALLSLGDVRAAQGDVAGAQAAWKQILAMTPSGDRDPVKRYLGYAEQRATLVGSTAPEIDSKDWLGGEPKALSAHKGSVVVLDFWATWCPPCRAVMPELDAFQKAKAPEGVVTLGITRFYANGFMPKPGAKDLLRDGEAMKGITEADYPAHLKQFKENSGISYPFVTATEAEFKAYKVSGIPTMAVVDRTGTIVFVKVGGGDETLLKLAVDSALKAGAGGKAPPKPVQ